MAGIDPIGNPGSGAGSSGSSYSDFLNAINEAMSAQFITEETLNKLKITNVKALGLLTKQQQEELNNAYTAFRLKALAQERDKRFEVLKKEHDQQDKDAKDLTEKQFKAKWGFTKKQLDKEHKEQLKNLEDYFEHREEAIDEEAEREHKKAVANIKKQAAERLKQNEKTLFGAGHTFQERAAAWKEMTTLVDENGNEVTASKGAKTAMIFGALSSALGDFAKKLENTIDKVGGYKSAIDTRLQGSKHDTNWSGSYWEQISHSITGAAGVSPLIKQADVAERVKTLVSQGIAFNVEQRATLDVMKDKIADTFNAANGTLLRLVRIQQQDTTAGRLGMESALTAFLNNMYETTEYMGQIADGIKGNLEEAMSLMSGENALSFEYQVQKWLGSMYSTGMSQQSVQGLGGVLGKLAAGQLDAISGGGQGNLVIMAANQAGMSISDILSNGLNADTTNQLMNSMVEYLAKIYEEAGDSKVIQQQMASVYGMNASDLKAAVNLAKSAGIVSRDGLTYSSAMARLNNMANSMYARTSVGELASNLWDNAQYSMAAGIANNPALYALYKTAGLLDNVAGGIEFSVPLVMGSGSAQTFKVADLMRVTALTGGIFSSMAQMIGGQGGGGLVGSGILKAMGIGNNISAVSRGSGTGLVTTGGATVSESGSMVGNASDSDVSSKTMTDATDSSKSSTASAVDESEETKLKDIRSDVVDIYHLLQNFANGQYTVPVEVKNTTLKVETEGGAGGM